MLRCSERCCKGKFPRLAEIQFAGESNVAVYSMIELIIHLKVAVQVRPPIALPHVTTRHSGKGDCSRHREPHSLLAGHKNAPSIGGRNIASVAISTYLKMRGTERVHFQCPEKRVVRAGQPRALQETGQMRICDHIFADGVAPIQC